MCFPAVASPMSSCQYTMVPLQGLALVGHCPLDGHMTAPHGVYPINGDCSMNGKPHHLPGQQQVESGPGSAHNLPPSVMRVERLRCDFHTGGGGL